MLTSSFLCVALAALANAGPAVIHHARPQTIPLNSRRISGSSSIAKRGLSSINVPLTDYYNGTDLQ